MSFSLRSLAKHMGVTLHAVQLARDSGRIAVDANGKIPDLDAARKQWASRSEARGNRPVALRPAGEPRRPQVKSHRAAKGKAGLGASLVGRRLALVVPASGAPAELDAASAVLLKRAEDAEHEVATMLGGTDLWLLGDDDQQRELLDAVHDGLVIIRELALHGVES